MQKSKGKLRRRTKYPGLTKRVTSKVRQELIDFDYIDKLSDKEKQWLSDFMEEWNASNFQHGGKIMHRSKKAKRDCYSRNNARNRDAMSIAKATGHLVLASTSTSGNAQESNYGIIMQKPDGNPHAVEDALNYMLDRHAAKIYGDRAAADMKKDQAETVRSVPLKKNRNKFKRRSKSRNRKK